jgi:light-regulated signal transduction histidine kinase (bacteriophytochrome)
MLNHSPENLQKIVNVVFNDLSGPLNLMHNWIDMLEQAHREQDEELMKQCIQWLQSSSGQIQEVWQAMRDLYGL